jgi:bisanhydrobacterioruberin hydratase
VNSLKTYLFYFLILVYLSGSIGMFVAPGFFLPFTPFSLLLTSCVFLLFQDYKNVTYLSAFAAVALLGFLAEWMGIKTGRVFGHYYYGNTLGVKLSGVPLVIPLNWALLVNAGILISNKFTRSRLNTSLCSAALITLLDVSMEFCAARLDYWHFDGGLAGLQNYLAWFVVSFLASSIFYPLLKRGDARIAIWIILLQQIYFGTILLSYHLTL